MNFPNPEVKETSWIKQDLENPWKVDSEPEL